MKPITVLLADDNRVVRKNLERYWNWKMILKWWAKRKTAFRQSTWPRNFVPHWF